MSLMKKQKWILSSLISLFLIINFFIPTPSNSKEKTVSLKSSLFGKVKIIDGDTIIIRHWMPKDKIFKNFKVRLFGIDAPEKKQICKDRNNKDYNCGIKSSESLKRIIENKNVLCVHDNVDIYGRILGICGVESIVEEESYWIWLNTYMVTTGDAVAFLKYSKKYLYHESVAKNLKLGIWQGEFDMPWEWRKKNK